LRTIPLILIVIVRPSCLRLFVEDNLKRSTLWCMPKHDYLTF
jgi:hypothetical protein